MRCRMRALAAVVLVFSAACGQDLAGPREVKGTLGGSVYVECSYVEGYRDYPKYWCRGAERFCDTVVKTSDSEREVRNDRVTIRDSPRTGTFTVTMDGLRREDAGMYRCGIHRTALLDPLFTVSVVVLTASTTLKPTTILVKTASSPPTPTPSASTNTPSITSTDSSGTCFEQSTFDSKTPEGPHSHQPHPTSPHSLPRSSDWIVLYLLPAGAFLLILLLLAAVFMIRSQRNKKKAFHRSSSTNNGTAQPPDRPPYLMESTEYAVVKKPTASSSATPETYYAEIRDPAQETARSQGITYAQIQFKDAVQQQDVYINMQVMRKDPSVQCEYDTVRV